MIAAIALAYLASVVLAAPIIGRLMVKVKREKWPSLDSGLSDLEVLLCLYLATFWPLGLPAVLLCVDANPLKWLARALGGR